jgi:hypothetical protein
MRSNRRLFLFAAAAALVASPASATETQHAPPDRQQRLTSAETYLPLPTLSAAVIQREATRGTLVVDMGIDVQDTALRQRAGASAPRLRDALRTALATYATVYYRNGAAPDPVVLARLMQQAVDRTLGAPGARVLLTNILYQRRMT